MLMARPVPLPRPLREFVPGGSGVAAAVATDAEFESEHFVLVVPLAVSLDHLDHPGDVRVTPLSGSFSTSKPDMTCKIFHLMSTSG